MQATVSNLYVLTKSSVTDALSYLDTQDYDSPEAKKYHKYFTQILHDRTMYRRDVHTVLMDGIERARKDINDRLTEVDEEVRKELVPMWLHPLDIINQLKSGQE